MRSVLASMQKILRSNRVYSGVTTNALSSIGNFAVSISLARTLSIGEVGEFAIAFAIYALLTGLIRAGVCEPMLATLMKVDKLKTSASRVSLLSLIFAFMLCLIGLFWNLPYLVVTALTIHGLSIYDFSKTMNLAVFNGKIPLMQESAWTAFSILAGLLVVLGEISGFWGYIIWAISGSLIGYGSAAMQHFELKPKWQQSAQETKNAMAFGGDYLIGSGSSQVAFNLVGFVAGLATVGSLRAGGTLLGPVSIIISSARSLAIPYLAKGISTGWSEAISRSFASSLIMFVATSPVLLFLAFIPDSIGNLFLGENWEHASSVLPYLALEMGFIALTTVPFSGFRALLAGRATLVIRSALAVFRVCLVVFAAWIGGMVVVAIAMAVASGVGMLVWWVGYLIQLKKREK